MILKENRNTLNHPEAPLLFSIIIQSYKIIFFFKKKKKGKD